MLRLNKPNVENFNMSDLNKAIEFDVLDLMSHSVERLTIIVPHQTVFYNVFSASEKQNFYVAIWDYDKDLYKELKENNTVSIYNINNDFMFIQITNAIILDNANIYSIDDLNKRYSERLKKYCIYHKSENSFFSTLKEHNGFMSINPINSYKEIENAIMSVPRYEITNIWRPVKFAGSYEGLCATCSTVNLKENWVGVDTYDLWRLSNHYFEDYISDSIDIIDLYRNSKKKIMSFGE